MSQSEQTSTIDPNTFTIETLDDEIAADRQCTELLRTFAASMVRDHDAEPVEAGRLAHGADPFLRDFMIADRRENLFSPAPGRIRQYAGHFYIIHALEPNRRELAGMLEGIEAFYRFARELGLVTEATFGNVSRECADIDEYARRIEAFLDLEGDGFFSWRDAIPLD